MLVRKPWSRKAEGATCSDRSQKRTLSFVLRPEQEPGVRTLNKS